MKLYRVHVGGGGSFLYDAIDVGRFARRMAECGDTRTFTVRPWTHWRRICEWVGQ